MNSRNQASFLVTAVVGIVVVVTLALLYPTVDDFTGAAAAEPNYRTASVLQQTDPALLVPESTLPKSSQRYTPNWDDNPVATIPESTMGRSRQRYTPNWDDNPVATIPESTMGQGRQRYTPNWDDNPVATIPESTMSSH